MVHTYGTVEAGERPKRSATRDILVAVATLAGCAAAVAIIMAGAASMPARSGEPVGLSQYGMSSRIMMLMEDKPELSAEDVRFLKHYDQCQSCLVGCDHYEENNCDSFDPKKACLWEDLMGACPKCEHKGCGPVVAYMEDSESLNNTYGDDMDAKAAAVEEMAWRDACLGSTVTFPKFEECIHEASTVAHAHNCLKVFLHPMPANILNLAHKIAKTVGPPSCAMSYTGHECSPAPKPEDHEGTCPQGFMCMPEPSKCESCACSCNTPADKLKGLENCLQRAGNPHAGSFCLATFFSQLPPDFVDDAIDAAAQPKGVDEHYDQILQSCGGEENGTATVTQCLEQVEYCVRPIQGKAGTFPEDESKYQSICECFRDEKVLASCGNTTEEATECAGAVQEHFVYHVHNTYCKEHTEAACNFQCQWPLPGFFGDVAKKAEEEMKQAEKAKAK